MKFKVGFGPGLICLLTLTTFCCIMTCLASQPSNGAITGDKPSYEENFSTSKNSFFDSYSDNISSNYFENGKYRISIFQMKRFSADRTVKVPKDFKLEVEATQVTGPNDNGYGVLFGYKSEGNYYYFLISGDGYYLVGGLINNIWSAKSMNIWEKSDAIHTGNNVTNLINMTCNEGRFIFYVNDKYVYEFTDDNSNEGRIGLMVEAEKTPGTVTIDFDNLKVWWDKQT
jgi:hypothetical protein